MVYVTSLGLTTKKALEPERHQSGISGIIGTMSIDPAVFSMGVVLLGPGDLIGLTGRGIPETIVKRHKGICVTYLCTNDCEAKLFQDVPHVKQVKKIKNIVTTEAITEFYGEGIKTVDPEYHFSAGRTDDLSNNPGSPRPMSLAGPKPAEETPAEPPKSVEFDSPSIDGVAPIGEQSALSSEVERSRTPSAEGVIDSAKTVRDWDTPKKQINRDSVIRQPILEDNEFVRVANMLGIWDFRVRDIWVDNHKSNEEKVKTVQEFDASHQVLQATYNSVLVNRFASLMEHVIFVCSSTAGDRCNEIADVTISIHQNKDAFLEKAVSGEDSLGDTLCERMAELQSIEDGLCKMFVFLHHEDMEEITARLGEKLPSNSEYINDVLSVSSKLLQPSNTVNLARSILDALAKGRVQLPLIEDKIKGLMGAMFQATVEQNRAIQYQRDIISCLCVSNVRSLVVRDSLLKERFNVVIGSEHAGPTITPTIYAGMLDRRDSTPVVDLTGHSHHDRCGYDAVQLGEFMMERKQQSLLFMTGSVGNNPGKVFHLMEELRSWPTYFRRLIIALDTAQLGILDQVDWEALSISYMISCMVRGMVNVTSAYEAGRRAPDVCHRLICIDSPVDVGILVSTLKMDISITKLAPVPYLREIKQAAAVRRQPHTYSDVLCVLEEASGV